MMFQESDKLVNKFYKDADTFVKKLKTVHIPVKVVESEHFLGTTDGVTYSIVPRK